MAHHGYGDARFVDDMQTPSEQPEYVVKLLLYASLAQLVEQRTVNPCVAGSCPAGGANILH